MPTNKRVGTDTEAVTSLADGAKLLVISTDGTVDQHIVGSDLKAQMGVDGSPYVTETITGDGVALTHDVTHNWGTEHVLMAAFATIDGKDEQVTVRARPADTDGTNVLTVTVDQWGGVADAALPDGVEVTVYVWKAGRASDAPLSVRGAVDDTSGLPSAGQVNGDAYYNRDDFNFWVQTGSVEVGAVNGFEPVAVQSGGSGFYLHVKAAGGAVNPEIQAHFDNGMLELGDAVSVLGYYEESNIGAGQYRVVAAATGTDDGGSYIDFTGFQLEAVFGGTEIHAGRFGAKGDNAANDTTAIQNAIAYAASRNGGVVQFHPGRFRVTSLSMKKGVWLAAPEIGTPQYTADQQVRIAGIGGTGTIVIDTPTTEWGWGLRGLHISGSGTASIGVRIRNNSKSIGIQGCMVQGFQDQGIQIASGSGICTITDVLVLQVLQAQGYTVKTGAIEISGNDCYLTNVETGCSMDDPSDTNNCVGLLVNGNANFFTNVVSEFADHAIYVSGKYNQFSNVRADRSQRYGFWVYQPGGSASWNQFSNCKALDNGIETADTYDGWYVQNAGGNSFTNCHSTITTHGSHRYGFYDDCAYADISTGLINDWVACRSLGHSTDAFNLGAGAGKGSLPVSSGGVSRPGTTGATTRNVRNAKILILEDSSATTIATLSNGQNGQELVVIALNGNTTIANNSTIKTNTGSDVTLAASRSYRLTLWNGAWYMS